MSELREVSVAADGLELPGTLGLTDATGPLVVFAHGSGSSRHSPRNQHVAERLRAAGLGTLLFDLLTPDEARDRANVFDIPLLGRRVVGAVRWAREEVGDVAVGVFGASTGAAAALVAAAELADVVEAVVSRGGRPDLARDHLADVRAPTLLLVGGLDTPVIGMNEDAAARMTAPHEVRIIDGAGHLFEEPGALDQVADLAAAWFDRHLARDRTGR